MAEKTDKIYHKELNKKIIIHEKCGNQHIDKGKWKKFNHSRHLCEYCKEFFYDVEKSIGI